MVPKVMVVPRMMVLPRMMVDGGTYKMVVLHYSNPGGPLLPLGYHKYEGIV